MEIVVFSLVIIFIRFFEFKVQTCTSLCPFSSSVKPTLNVEYSAIILQNETVNVSLGSLQEYISKLPKLLTKNITINVTGNSGDYIDSNLFIIGFYGAGKLIISGQQTNGINDLTIKGEVQVDNSTCLITLQYFNLEALSYMTINTNGCIHAFRSPKITVFGCNITGNNLCCGVVGYEGGEINFDYGTIKNCKWAFRAVYNSRISIVNNTSEISQYTGNNTMFEAIGNSYIGSISDFGDLFDSCILQGSLLITNNGVPYNCATKADIIGAINSSY